MGRAFSATERPRGFSVVTDEKMERAPRTRWPQAGAVLIMEPVDDPKRRWRASRRWHAGRRRATPRPSRPVTARHGALLGHPARRRAAIDPRQLIRGRRAAPLALLAGDRRCGGRERALVGAEAVGTSRAYTRRARPPGRAPLRPPVAAAQGTCRPLCARAPARRPHGLHGPEAAEGLRFALADGRTASSGCSLPSLREPRSGANSPLRSRAERRSCRRVGIEPTRPCEAPDFSPARLNSATQHESGARLYRRRAARGAARDTAVKRHRAARSAPLRAPSSAALERDSRISPRSRQTPVVRGSTSCSTMWQ